MKGNDIKNDFGLNLKENANGRSFNFRGNLK